MKKKSIVFVLFTMFLSVLILSNGQWTYANEGDYSYKTILNDDGTTTVTITKYIGSGGDVTIPSELGGETVTGIGRSAFNEVSSLTTVKFEAGSALHTIGDWAFARTGLTTITLPKSVTEIGSHAFDNASLLGTVEFEAGSALQTIGNDAFRSTGLTTIKFPKSVTEIGSYAFNVLSLETVDFEDGSALHTIGNDAFRSTVLTTITLPKSVTEIGSKAFYNASLLGTVEFEPGSKLHTIGENAFAYTGLTTITLPKSVKEIGSDAFYEASSLKTVEFEAGSELHTIGENAFAYTGLTSIRIPSSVVDMGKDIFSPKTTDFTIMSLLDKGAHYATDYNHKHIALYQLKYDGNGHTAGDVPEDKEEYLSADPITVLPQGNLVKDGYRFVGWNTASDGSGEKVQAGEQLLYQDVGGTLYAQWQYTVTFDSTGGSTIEDALVDSNALLSPPTSPTQSGHTFVGWYTDTTFTTPWNFATGTVQGNMTLYAKWQHTVTFDSTGGSTIEDALVDSNALLSPPTSPTQSGHTFVDWYTDTTFMTPWNFATGTVQGDMTLYAKWTVSEYTITFDSQGGSAVPDIEAHYETNITAPTPPTRSGRRFVDWYTDPTFTTPWSFAVDTVQGDMTLYAKWKPRPAPPPLNIQATMATDEVLTEEQLDDSTITVNVSDTNFMMSLTPEHFELQNAPIGLTIREVKRISSWQVELTLAFDGTPLEQDYDFGLTIHGAALTTGFNVIVNDTIQIQKNKIPYKIITKEGTFEPTKVWTVKLSNEVDASTVQDALYIVDAEGNPVPAVFTSEGSNIFIQPPTENYAEGTYTLYITSKLKNKNGTDLKEPIKMIFTIEAIEEPEQEETYTTITEEGTFPSDKIWEVDLLIDIDPATVEDGVYLEDVDGNKIPAIFTIDGTSIIVQAPVDGYAEGTYTLYITSKLKNKNGTDLKESIKMIFTIGEFE